MGKFQKWMMCKELKCIPEKGDIFPKNQKNIFQKEYGNILLVDSFAMEQEG